MSVGVYIHFEDPHFKENFVGVHVGVIFTIYNAYLELSFAVKKSGEKKQKEKRKVYCPCHNNIICKDCYYEGFYMTNFPNFP